jgi:predicted nuclease of predicted toxin-antitoxin system
MVLKKAKFLLDENVPLQLKKVFDDQGYFCTTVPAEGWSGIKNGELSKTVKNNNFLLVTRDKDFTFLWKKHKIQVIYLAIEPAIIDFIQPRLIDLIIKWNYDLSRPFLLILQKDAIRFWQ